VSQPPATGPLIDSFGSVASFEDGTRPMTDDPDSPYKLYDGDKLVGTYVFRAEARRAKQKLEDEAGEKQRLCFIKDKHDRIVL
jgi:hypothetical protein